MPSTTTGVSVPFVNEPLEQALNETTNATVATEASRGRENPEKPGRRVFTAIEVMNGALTAV
jgi:hypothetical protein